MVVFITGGIGSGKSAFALKLAEQFPWSKFKKIFIATAQPIDDEMRKKIIKHKKEREGMGWKTYEEPIKITDVIRREGQEKGVTILECITTWLTNLYVTIEDKNRIKEIIEEFIYEVGKIKNMVIIIVSNEVNMGIIPMGGDTRQWIEDITEINRKIVQISDMVFLMVSGIGVRIK